MPIAANAIASLDLATLPKSSLVRLYDPATPSNSFWLDGFPAIEKRDGSGTVPFQPEWLTRLVEMIELCGAIGMTTNQTLFRQLLETGTLDERLKEMKGRSKSAEEIYQTLYNEAATLAARCFEKVHARWPWEGRVSQEASALLTEVEPLVKEVRRIARAMEGLGSFTKVPNLGIGPQVLEKVVAGEGLVHPNVTLVFSDRHYLQTVEGYLLGLEKRARSGDKDLSRIFSVNSLFVSRVDRVVDPMIEERLKMVPGTGLRPEPGTIKLLKGKVAVAQGKLVYRIFETIFLGAVFQDPERLCADSEGIEMVERMNRLKTIFARLKGSGARPQRLLIASSGVKSDQPYSPLLYVLPFLGPWHANTMPEGTLEIFSRFVGRLSDEQAASLKKRNLMREGLPAIPTDSPDWDRILLMTAQERKAEGIGELTPDQILRRVQAEVLEPKGTSLRAICDILRDKGAASFTADEQATLQAIQAKLQSL